MDWMPGWVEDDARKEALIYRDGPEVWRNLKLSLGQAVHDYTRIYSPPGTVEVEYSDCAPVTEYCVRIRVPIPSATKPITHILPVISMRWCMSHERPRFLHAFLHAWKLQK